MLDTFYTIYYSPDWLDAMDDLCQNIVMTLADGLLVRKISPPHSRSEHKISDVAMLYDLEWFSAGYLGTLCLVAC